MSWTRVAHCQDKVKHFFMKALSQTTGSTTNCDPHPEGQTPIIRSMELLEGPLTCGPGATTLQWSYKVFLFFFFLFPLYYNTFFDRCQYFWPQIFRHLVLDLYLISCYNYYISEKEITMNYLKY